MSSRTGDKQICLYFTSISINQVVIFVQACLCFYKTQSPSLFMDNRYCLDIVLKIIIIWLCDVWPYNAYNYSGLPVSSCCMVFRMSLNLVLGIVAVKICLASVLDQRNAHGSRLLLYNPHHYSGHPESVSMLEQL